MKSLLSFKPIAHLIQKPPRNIDVLFLSIFTFLITLQPYYRYGAIDYFEWGIYLPGLDALLDGRIPYRDFFYLRGPFELYFPAFFMSLFGTEISVLSTCFYLGTIITLILAVCLAKEILNSRLVFYLFVPVLVARTFPRVVFHIWGGMRYGWGLFALLLAIYFIKSRKLFWLVFSGVVTAIAFFTSVEIGCCAFLGIGTALIVDYGFGSEKRRTPFLVYTLGGLAIIGPYALYLWFTQSGAAYLENTLSVIMSMTKVFPDYFFSAYPRGPKEIFLALTPWSPFFKHTTPLYAYLFLALYGTVKIKKEAWGSRETLLWPVAVYGLSLYLLAFRKIGAAQFEMALQPEKIVLFFLLGEFLLFLLRPRGLYAEISSGHRPVSWKFWGINFLLLAFVMSSLGYAQARYNRRFWAYKYLKARLTGRDPKSLNPLSGQETETLTLDRAKGMVVPAWQAEEYRQLVDWAKAYVAPDEAVLAFPEIGMYNFIINRPFIGRFPVYIFSWTNDRWQKEFMRHLRSADPEWILVPKKLDPVFNKVYLRVPSNREKFYEVGRYIQNRYSLFKSTQTLNILRRK